MRQEVREEVGGEPVHTHALLCYLWVKHIWVLMPYPSGGNLFLPPDYIDKILGVDRRVVRVSRSLCLFMGCAGREGVTSSGS